MRKILIAGVPDSSNIGDRLIAFSLNKIISEQGYNQITHFDLLNGCWDDTELRSLNKGLSNSVDKQGQASLKLRTVGVRNKLTPNLLRQMKTLFYDKKSGEYLNRQLKEAISAVDLVLIGGGHLLIDTNWTFPLAINRIVAEAMRQSKPYHLVLVGARGPWSMQAKKWMLNACKHAASISVRDEDSRRFLIQMEKMLENKVVSFSDPALFTIELLNRGESFQAKRPVVGLGIMDPYEMNRHCNLRWERSECAVWWAETAKILLSRGYDVNIFTNGAKTDNAFVEEYLKPLIGERSEITFANYPITVAQLVNNINKCNVIVAQRLHACIPGISLGKPTYGVIWDRKLENIFKDLQLGNYLIDFRKPLIETINQIMQLENLPVLATETIARKKSELKDYFRGILS